MSRKIKFVNGQMVEFEIFKLVDKYDPILKKPTIPVDFETTKGSEIAYLAISLMETLNHYSGLGLSANQVGLPHRMFALNMGDKIWCLINPKIIERSNEKSQYKEGCLSYPGLYLNIGRPKAVTVEFQAVNGETLVQQFDGLTATCVQHEIDHLDGKVFTDLVPRVVLDREKSKVKTNLKKMKRMALAV